MKPGKQQKTQSIGADGTQLVMFWFRGEYKKGEALCSNRKHGLILGL